MRPVSSRAEPVAARREPPLSDQELREVRGLLDQSAFRRMELRFWGGLWGYAVKTIVGLGALAVLASSIKQLVSP